MRLRTEKLDCTLTLIAEGLRRNSENTTRDELPKRYIDLIKVLAEQERVSDRSLSLFPE